MGSCLTAGAPFPSPFASFWQAGYEGADHINGSAQPLSMPQQTDHVRQAGTDYARAHALKITTVRESLGWRQTDLGGGQYDFSCAGHLETRARVHGVQILWTLCHYGVPHQERWFSDGFIERFARYCQAFARYLVEHHPSGTPRVFTPINEISFLSWAACETGLMHPPSVEHAGQGYALKRRLVQASLAACDAIWAVDPTARMLNVDPLIAVVAEHPEHDGEAAHQTQLQYQAWDMLCGLAEPQLGGSPRHLDLVGVNYYPSNQWELPSLRTLAWPGDARRSLLHALLGDVWSRYRRPLVVSETSHVDKSKGPWLMDVARSVRHALDADVPVLGICLYPALNRPDWEQPSQWHDSGLWHVDPPTHRRSLDLTYAQALQGARSFVDATPLPPQEFPMQTPHLDTLVVFSHLRWDFVYQRPQHLLSRLARSFNVIVVQEPAVGAAGMIETSPAAGVTLLQMTHPDGGEGFSDPVMPSMAEMLGSYLGEHRIDRYATWFYTPMALPVLQHLVPSAIVYDCMDELSGFKNAPHQLGAREATLLKIANAVFTGGPSLYEAKRDRNDAVHCFPSSVDAAHFGQARQPAATDPMYADVPHPRLGFYGVLDERLDVDLIRAVAARRPDWHLCLVGPVVKIDPATLPVADNIHYFPQQAYDALPGSLAAWDVCLLPFALNDATRFISPTKTLEYMCADKPVVSTAIRDVETLYAAGVTIAGDEEAFIDACARALAETPSMAAERARHQSDLVSGTSWDSTADAMAAIIRDAAGDGLTVPAQRYLSTQKVVPIDARKRQVGVAEETPCLIVGAGPTGLSAAMHVGVHSILVEANPTVGGWCRSVTDHGFTFDYAGHIMFSNDPYVLALYDKLLGANLHWQDRQAWIYSKQVYTRYPFQGALHGLPPKVLTECLVGAIEARFGSLQAEAAPVSKAREPVGADEAVPAQDCCADGTAVPGEGDVKDQAPATLSRLADKRHPQNFHEFIHQVWGAGVAKHFAVPYNTKLWTVPLEEMETSWLGGRVPLPNLEEMIVGALSPVQAPVGPNARFGYPLRGGFAALMEGFLPHLRGRIQMGQRMVAVDAGAKCATFDDGRRISYGSMISTIPLPQLIDLIGEQAPEPVRRAAAALKHVSVKCVNLGIGRPHLTDKHWIYFPEDTVFHRVFVQGNASPHNNPVGGFGLTCEITYSPTKPLPCDDRTLIERCIRECIEVGLFDKGDLVITANVVDMPYAYVIYDHARAENVARIRTWLGSQDIVLAGRYSEWEYYNSDHAFLAGKRAAETVAEFAYTGTFS